MLKKKIDLKDILGSKVSDSKPNNRDI